MPQSSLKKHTKLKSKDYIKKNQEITLIRSDEYKKHVICSKLRKKIHVWKVENTIRKWIATKRYKKSKTLSSYHEANINVTLFFVESEHFTEWNQQTPRVKEIYVEVFMNNYEAFQVLVSQSFPEQLEIIHILLEWSDIERVTGIKELEIITL